MTDDSFPGADAWSGENARGDGAFVVKWTDHTDGRRYLALVPQFTLAELDRDGRRAYIGLWEILEPTPARPGAPILSQPFDELVEPGETVTMQEFGERVHDRTMEVMEQTNAALATVARTFGPAVRDLVKACEPLVDGDG